MNTEQHELYEYARERIGQKKRLYSHFVVFIIGSLFLFAANKWIKIGEPTQWYIWAITAWLFIFILHFINVFVTNRFMNKKWERLQIDKLMALQEKKIAQLKNDIENSNL
jgi:hypothetical protein